MRDKYFKYQNFPTHFRLSLFLECFGESWNVLAKVVVLYSSLNKYEILAHKGSQTTRATPEDYLDSRNRNPIKRDNGTTRSQRRWIKISQQK